MTINRIAVIGAGIMGRGIAYVSAVGGFETTIEDIRSQVLGQAMDWLRRAIDEGVARGRISSEEARQAFGRVRTGGRVEEAADADLVIETGPEEMELKTELFGMLDKFARAGTVLATTSRSLPIAEMAGITQRPELCIGMRFLEPPMDTRRLELVCAPETSEDTLKACLEVGRRMGMEVVTLSESPRIAPSSPDAVAGGGNQKPEC
ncbi:MAG TPA: 3-hydroxyacyl-CoA dehydrogenase family protein [Patescibacteria group bacterium]|nr:3-hydroxyacyl-CoA dehydrogenase family protein [Patescibacteria group bacterium]